MLHGKFNWIKPVDFSATDWKGSAYERMTSAFRLDPATAMLTKDMHNHMAMLFIEAIETAGATQLDPVRTAVHRSFRSSPLSVFGSHFLDHLTDVVAFALFLRSY